MSLHESQLSDGAMRLLGSEEAGRCLRRSRKSREVSPKYFSMIKSTEANQRKAEQVFVLVIIDQTE